MTTIEQTSGAPEAAIAACAGVVFDALCKDAGCAVAIANRDGQFLFANERSRDWMAWHDPGNTDAIQPHIQLTCDEAMLDERLGFVRMVCDEGASIAYESISRGMRHLVSLRPIGEPGATPRFCLTIARRMRPWERVTSEARPEAIVVHPDHHDPGPLGLLSRREFEVLIMIGQGHSYAEISQMFHRSVRTIERHRDRICQKIGADNRVDLARFAIRAGLAELPDPADAAMLTRRPYDPLDLSPPIARIAATRGGRAT